MGDLFLITDHTVEKQVRVRLSGDQLKAIQWLFADFHMDNMELKPVIQDEIVDLTIATGDEDKYLKVIKLKYYRSGKINKERFIELLKKVKGTRSIRQFAIDMDVNASSISRLLSGKTTKASDIMLSKLSVQAERSGIVAPEIILEAQGMKQFTSTKQNNVCRESDCRTSLKLSNP